MQKFSVLPKRPPSLPKNYKSSRIILILIVLGIYNFGYKNVTFFLTSSPDAKIPTKLQLEDNGNGLVDLTQNDGIYSAIFPYVGQVAGFFSVQVIADDNDQQAMLPKSPQSIQVGKFCKIY